MAQQRVMVVEDDGSLCKLIASALRSQDVDADCYGTSELAVMALAERPYSAIVLDIVLPGSSGLYVIEAMKQLQIDPRPPVVVITGTAPNKLQHIDRSVVKAIIFKPLAADSLAAFVKGLCA